MDRPAETADRTAVARDRIADIVGRHLTSQPLSAVEAVREIMALAAEIGHIRVGCRADGAALTVRFRREPDAEVELPRARSHLRSMCANLAVRAAIPSQLPIIYGGVAYLPFEQDGHPGFTLKMMNTMDEHWFDLGSRAETH
jgi:hypothetical protein